MNKIILVMTLIVIVASAPEEKTETTSKQSDSFKEIRLKINECVLSSSPSEDLTSYVKQPGSIKRKDLSEEDRKILRNCAKKVLSIKQTKSYTVLPFKKPDNRSINLTNQPRKLSMLSGLASFNIPGIFTCIEYAQPAIKLIRGAILMIKSMDYTSAVISVYDNFSTIGDAFSFCYNAIFPGN